MMARIEPIPMDQMTSVQKRINDEIAGTRGGGAAKGPFALWLRTPELADKANAFGSYLRHQTSVPQNLVELAVLTIARAYSAQYEWHAHIATWEKLAMAVSCNGFGRAPEKGCPARLYPTGGPNATQNLYENILLDNPYVST